MDKQVQPALEGVPSLFGISCPVCRTCHITPKGYVLISGEAECQLCGAKFIVTDNAALIGNANSALLRGILGSLGGDP